LASRFTKRTAGFSRHLIKKVEGQNLKNGKIMKDVRILTLNSLIESPGHTSPRYPRFR
jgi:hypothetical protein